MTLRILHRPWYGLLLGAAALAGGCDSAAPYRGIIREQTRAWEEMEKILSTVTDEASMKAAQKELAKSWARYHGVQERAQRLSDPTNEIMERVREDADTLERAFTKATEQIQRISKLPGGKEFLEQHPGK